MLRAPFRATVLAILGGCSATAIATPSSIPISPPSPHAPPLGEHGKTLGWGSALAFPDVMAMDATAMFWLSDDGKLRTMSRQGGPVRILASEASRHDPDIALDAQRVYWIGKSSAPHVSSNVSVLFSMPKDGKAPPAPIVEASKIGNLAHDGERLFYDAREGLFSVRPGQAPVALAPREPKDDRWYDLEVDASHVYWSQPSGIHRVPKGGGAVETVATERADSIALSKEHIYSIHYEQRRIFRLPKRGGPAQEIAASEVPISGLAVDEQRVCWGTYSDRLRCRDHATGTIRDVDAGWYHPRDLVLDRQALFYIGKSVVRSVPVNETWDAPLPAPKCPRVSPPEFDPRSRTPRLVLDESDRRLVDTGGSPQGIAVDDRAVYWTDGKRGEVVRWDKGLKTSRPLASGQANPLSLAMDGTAIYWTNDGDGSVMRVNKDGSDLRVLASKQRHPRGIVLDTARVYWANYGDERIGDGSIAVVGKSGGNISILARDLDRPSALAVDDESVFAATEVEGLVLRIPKGGGAVRVLGSSDNVHSIALDQDHVFWLDARSGFVHQVSKKGGAASIVAPTGQVIGDGGGLMLRGPSVFFSSHNTLDSEIQMVSKHKGCPKLFTDWNPSRLPIRGMAADTEHLYWIAGSKVHRKPIK